MLLLCFALVSSMQYDQGDYFLLISEPYLLSFPIVSLVVFHNPSYFNCSLGSLDALYTNISNITVESKNSSQTIYFSVFAIPPSQCDTLDIYVGGVTFFNVFSSSQSGNVTMKMKQDVCVIFTSPHIMTYTFFAKDIETANCNLEIITYTTTQKLQSGFLSYIRNSVMMKWHYAAHLSGALSGAAGLCKTQITTYNNNPEMKYVVGLMPMPNSFKNSSFCGQETASDFSSGSDKWGTGDYQITIPQTTVCLNFNKNSIIMFHNPNLFSGQAYVGDWMKIILAKTAYIAVNFTVDGFLNISANSGPTICYFSVFDYTNLTCDTMDVSIGTKVNFSIEKDRGNMTLSKGQNNCIFFSSPTDVTYFSSVEDIQKDSMLVLFYPTKLIETILNQTSNQTSARRSLLMQWKASEQAQTGAVSLSSIFVEDLSLNAFLKGSTSYVSQPYCHYKPSNDFMIYQGPVYQTTQRISSSDSTGLLSVGAVLGISFGLLFVVLIFSCLIVMLCSKRGQVSGFDDDTSEQNAAQLPQRDGSTNAMAFANRPLTNVDMYQHQNDTQFVSQPSYPCIDISQSPQYQAYDEETRTDENPYCVSNTGSFNNLFV